MKKPIIFTIIIVSIAIVLLAALIGGGFLFVNKLINGNKKSISEEDFYNVMKDNEYIVYDAKQQFIDYDYIQYAYIAKSKEANYQIEFYKIADNENAKLFYANNKSKFENLESSKKAYTNKDLKNSSKYTLLENGRYMVVSRIDDTVIYINVDEQYAKDIKNILNKIGY